MEIQVQQHRPARARTTPRATAQSLAFPVRLAALDPIQRTLAHAADPTLSLLDRLRHLCTVSSMLDAFFEFQVAKPLEQERKDLGAIIITRDIAVTLAECRAIVDTQYAMLEQAILPELAQSGIHLLRPDQFNAAQSAWAKHYFMRDIRPLLTPIGLDSAHPFPQVSTKALNFVVELDGRDAFGRGSRIAIMRAPRVLSRLIKMPFKLHGQRGNSYCLLSFLIQSHIAELFPGRKVLACSQFRLTRNSSAPAACEQAQLSGVLSGELRRRLYGFPVRLEVEAMCPHHLAALLLGQFGLPRERLFAVDGPLNLVHLIELDECGPRAFFIPPMFAAMPVSASETKQPHDGGRATIQA